MGFLCPYSYLRMAKFTEQDLIDLTTQRKAEMLDQKQYRSGWGCQGVTFPILLIAWRQQAGREGEPFYYSGRTQWKTEQRLHEDTELSSTLMSSSELYNLPVFFPWEEVNKEKGGRDPKWKQSSPPVNKHKEVKPTPSWKAKVLLILTSKPDHRYLSFYNYLTKLCNLTLDTTKP